MLFSGMPFSHTFGKRYERRNVWSLLFECSVDRSKCPEGNILNTSNSYDDFELRSRRFHFDLVYFENLARRIKCNLINLSRERLLRNSKSPVLNLFIECHKLSTTISNDWFRSRRSRHVFLHVLRSKCCADGLESRRRHRWNETVYTSTPDFRSRRDRNETVYFEVRSRP